MPLARLTSTLVIFYSTAHCKGPTPSTPGWGPPRSQDGGAHHRVIGWVFWFVAQFGRTGYLVRLRSRWRLRTSRSRHAEKVGGMLTHKCCRRVSHIPSLRRGTSDGTGDGCDRTAIILHSDLAAAGVGGQARGSQGYSVPCLERLCRHPTVGRGQTPSLRLGLSLFGVSASIDPATVCPPV